MAPAAPSTMRPPGNAWFSGYSQRTTPLDCPCGLQSAAQAGTESHFTFLNNSETNTQTQTYFGHSQTRSSPRRKKKISILLTPNWFYDSMVRHYSTSLNDINDLILQKLPHFLGQSPNILLVTLGRQGKQCVPMEQHLCPASPAHTALGRCPRNSQVNNCAWAPKHQNSQSLFQHCKTTKQLQFRRISKR